MCVCGEGGIDGTWTGWQSNENAVADRIECFDIILTGAFFFQNCWKFRFHLPMEENFESFLSI